MTMLTYLKKIALRILVLLALFFFIGSSPCLAQAESPTPPQTQPKNILLLYSYGYGSKGIGIFDDGLLNTLNAGGVGTNQLFFEFLDLERNKADPEYRLRMQSLLGRKYKNRLIDLIVTVQQPALDFLLHEGFELASNAPAITVQAPMPTEAEAKQRRFVSLLANFDIKGTLERALELFPNIRRVVFVSGSSEADQKMAAQAASMALSWQGKLEFEYTADLSLDAMLKRVASLPPSSIIIFTQYNRGANGQVTVAYEVEGMITKVANAPVFGLYDFNLANGGMGGSVVSVNGLGQKTGKLALDILSGQRALTQPITRLDVKAIPMFDWGQVQRWGGVASRLPDNAIFVNRVPTFWEQYKLYVLGFALFIVAQSFLIAALWVNKRRKEQAQAELARERDTAQLYLDIAGVMLMALDSQGRIMMINRKGAQILGEPENALLGKDWFENFIPEHQRSHVREVFNRIMSGDVLLLTQYENSIMDASGRERMMAWSNTLLRDASGAAIGTLSSADDITERKKSEERIQDLAFFDQLTGLPNRTLLQDRVKQTLAVSSRSGSYGALLFIDLDNFKTLNDTLGHDMGDQLLKLVAQRLKMGVREGDTVTRFGGDEFVVVLSELGSSEGDAAAAVEVVTDKILASLNQPYQLGNMPHHNTASIGIALFHGDLKSVDDLMKQADLAMYKAKAAGRNVARFFDPTLESALKERAAMEEDLRLALDQKHFLLHFQAQVVEDGRITGAEALVRWQHPQRGLVSPLEFIPLAEETGLILPLGHWVLETACTQLAVWAAQPEMAHLSVAVNVSARQFHHADFVAQVLTILEDTGANPHRLKLELTESLLVSNIEEIIEKMFVLKAKGVSFSLDDFGTGYSSLAYLKRLPLDQLKIDQSFVRDVLSDPNDAAIAKTVVALAQSLGLGVIAEGVETEGQRAFLARSGCHAYQGYLFSRPLPLQGFEALVRR